MGPRAVCTVLAFSMLVAAAVAAPGVALAEEEPDLQPAVVLTAVFLSPDNGTRTAHDTVAISLYGAGGIVSYVNDDFSNGTYAGAQMTLDGVGPNATAPPNGSSYTSPPLFLPAVGTHEWIPAFDVLITGGSLDPHSLINYSWRFGDAGGQNWSAWQALDITGSFNESTAPNETELAQPALQYRIDFLDPANTSTPKVVLVHAWYTALFDRLETRVGANGTWTVATRTPGFYNFSAPLTEGANVFEARAIDTAGHESFTQLVVIRDTTPPTVASAPAEGAAIPADGAAAIVFSEPLDPASASVSIIVSASFPVDVVWSADNTTLLLSAAAATTRGTVTVTIQPALRDPLGNQFGREQVYHYTMGAAPVNSGPADFIFVLLGLAATLGLIAVWHSDQVRRKNRAYAEKVVKEAEQEPPRGEPPK